MLIHMVSTVYSKFIIFSITENFNRQNGKSLFVNIHDNYQEAKGVKVGSVITVKHMGVNIYGTLQYPKFFRLRSDVSWDDLIQQQQQT